MHVRILIAEDENDLNQILTSRLKAEHYSVDSHRTVGRCWNIWQLPNTMP